MISIAFRRSFLSLAALALLLVSAMVSANQRIALVIGNAAYPESPLVNPVNDAVAIDAALKNLDFEVVRVTDADLDSMQGALLEFTGRIEEGATALVFYAGHGIQANGRNYLLPVDAKLDSEARLRFEALELAAVLEELEYARSRVNIVVLDACRNNPFMRRFRGGSRGLAAVDAATGTLVAYATAPGSVASDGSGTNGLYTEHLLEALRTPGLQAEAVFKQVRIAVSDSSGGEQVPWESSSLTGDFVFNRSAASLLATTTQTATAAGTGVPLMPMVRMPDAIAAGAEVVFWDSVRSSEDVAGYRAYLEQFPDGTFAGLARARIDGLQNARSSAQPEIATLPAAAPAPAAGERVVEVVNETGYTVVRLDVSATTSSAWGRDRLEGSPMAPGAERRIALGVQDDVRFDVRLTDSDGDTYSFRDYDVTAGPLRVTLLDLDSREDVAGIRSDHYVEVTNATGYEIVGLQVSPVAATDWGGDRLGSVVLAAGETFRVDLSAYADPVFDVRATDADGDTYTFRGVDVSRQDLRVTLGDLDDDAGSDGAYYVDVTNSTRYTMVQLQVSPVSSSSWEENVLGAQVLDPGETYRVQLRGYDNPRFDVRLTDEDGDTYTFRNVNVTLDDVSVTLSDLD